MKPICHFNHLRNWTNLILVKLFFASGRAFGRRRGLRLLFFSPYLRLIVCADTVETGRLLLWTSVEKGGRGEGVMDLQLGRTCSGNMEAKGDESENLESKTFRIHGRI